MDGPSAAKAMREMGYRGPIIGVTGNVMAKDVETFEIQGADKVLFKPLQFKILQDAVSSEYPLQYILLQCEVNTVVR